MEPQSSEVLSLIQLIAVIGGFGGMIAVMNHMVRELKSRQSEQDRTLERVSLAAERMATLLESHDLRLSRLEAAADRS